MGGSFKSRMAARKGKKDAFNAKGSRGTRVPKGPHCPTGYLGRSKKSGRSR